MVDAADRAHAHDFAVRCHSEGETVPRRPSRDDAAETPATPV
jgi:hypothetical protein